LFETSFGESSGAIPIRAKGGHLWGREGKGEGRVRDG